MLGGTIGYCRQRGGEGEFCGVLMKIGWETRRGSGNEQKGREKERLHKHPRKKGAILKLVVSKCHIIVSQRALVS